MDQPCHYNQRKWLELSKEQDSESKKTTNKQHEHMVIAQQSHVTSSCDFKMEGAEALALTTQPRRISGVNFEAQI